VRTGSISEIKRGQSSRSSPACVEGLRGSRVTAVSAGGGGMHGGHTLFAVNHPVPTLWACGHGRWGQLGVKAFKHVSPLEQVTTLAKLREWDPVSETVRPIDLQAVACGARHSAAVLAAGNVFTWGWSEAGQLGTGGTQGCHTPQMIKAPQDLRLSALRHVVCGPASTAAWD